MKGFEEKLRDYVARIGEDEWKRFLRFHRSFHEYSISNQMLILLQRPDATCVRGYVEWTKLGRHVKAGEKGIAILAPRMVKVKVKYNEWVTKEDGTSTIEEKEEEREKLMGFRVVYVFDVSQTEGKPLPDLRPEVDVEIENVGELLVRLYSIAERLGYQVVISDNIRGDGSANLSAKTITVREGLSDSERAHTMLHELAHILLQHTYNEDRGIVEFEAESVAFMVLDRLGVDVSDFTFPYVGGWLGDDPIKALNTRGKRIVETAEEIIGLLDVTSLLHEIPTTVEVA